MSDSNLEAIHETLLRIERQLEVMAFRLDNIDDLQQYQAHFVTADELSDRVNERTKELLDRMDDDEESS